MLGSDVSGYAMIHARVRAMYSNLLAAQCRIRPSLWPV